MYFVEEKYRRMNVWNFRHIVSYLASTILRRKNMYFMCPHACECRSSNHRKPLEKGTKLSSIHIKMKCFYRLEFNFFFDFLKKSNRYKKKTLIHQRQGRWRRLALGGVELKFAFCCLRNSLTVIFMADAIATQVDAFIPLAVLRSRSFVSRPLSPVAIFIFICSVSV